ncbi:MAG: dihydrofolate reductase family protein [Ktedonobacteraceae bacterium]
MRNVVVSEYVTLDGVMEDPGGVDTFKEGNWHFPFLNEEAQKYKHDELFACDALLLGRRTYQEFAPVWPQVSDETGYADRINSLPKYVVSTTLSVLSWNNSRLIKGNLAQEVTKLKHEAGQDMLVFGSGELVYQLGERTPGFQPGASTQLPALDASRPKAVEVRVSGYFWRR